MNDDNELPLLADVDAEARSLLAPSYPPFFSTVVLVGLIVLTFSLGGLFAAYFAGPIGALLLFRFLRPKSPQSRLLWVFVLVVIGLALFAVGGVYGLVAGVAVFRPTHLFLRHKSPRSRLVWVPALIIGLAATGLGVAFLVYMAAWALVTS